MASRNYQLFRQDTRLTTPTELKAKLAKVKKHAAQLLEALGIARADHAVDGVADEDIQIALISDKDRGDDQVRCAAEAIGKLDELVDAALAANLILVRSTSALTKAVRIQTLMVAPGHIGQPALHDWVGAVMAIYAHVTGNEPGTSVGSPEQENKGRPGGPLIRFLIAAGKPLDIEMTANAWRSRVRAIRNFKN